MLCSPPASTLATSTRRPPPANGMTAPAWPPASSASEGDTLVVWKLDRLGRDLRHLVNTVHDLTRAASASRCSPATAPASTPFRQRQAGLRHLRRPGRVRAGADHRAYEGGHGRRPRPGPQRRQALQDDRRQAPAGDGGDGQPGTKVGELCAELGITRQTLYRHVDARQPPADGRSYGTAPSTPPRKPLRKGIAYG